MKDAVGTLSDQLTAVGLLTHEQEIGGRTLDVLGVSLDFDGKFSRATGRRLWRVRGAIQHLLRKRKCSGRCLEALLGHCCFLGLIRREVLSVFCASYAFCRAH